MYNVQGRPSGCDTPRSRIAEKKERRSRIKSNITSIILYAGYFITDRNF
jgi:hypothetical protein